MIIKKVINIPIYTGKFIIIFCDESIKVAKIIPFNIEDKVYASAHRFNYNGKQGFGIVLNFNHIVKISHGTIAHECLHIVNFIFEYHGITFDINNDEPATYLLGWLVNKVYNLMNRNGIKID